MAHYKFMQGLYSKKEELRLLALACNNNNNDNNDSGKNTFIKLPLKFWTLTVALE